MEWAPAIVHGGVGVHAILYQANHYPHVACGSRVAELTGVATARHVGAQEVLGKDRHNGCMVSIQRIVKR
eukprot:scaffold648137_cov43-Prasinocladus_malaysianus.AAC.1